MHYQANFAKRFFEKSFRKGNSGHITLNLNNWL